MKDIQNCIEDINEATMVYEWEFQKRNGIKKSKYLVKSDLLFLIL